MKHGYLLGEHIKTGKFKKRNYDDTPRKVHLRGFLFPLVLCLVAGVFLWQLFSLQIIKGGEYRALADSNRVRTQTIHAPRGIIFDRNGVPLVLNTPGFRQLKNCTKETVKQCETVPLSQEEAIPLIAKGDRTIEVDSFREYPFKDSLAHVLGYIGQISEDELGEDEYTGYLGTDWIGKNGIERTYEHMLRGKDGRQLIEVDATGKPVRALGKEDPIPGQDVTLTLDSKLQEAVYEATKDMKRGVVIASRPNGEILSLISRPSFDPNLFTLDKTYTVSSTSAYSTVQSVLAGSTQPLLNRAIGGVYPPGSTFKIITSAAGLEKGIIDANYRVEDTGIITVGEFSYANWYFTQYGRKEPGKLDVTRALARSNDIFYYRLAEKVNVDRLSDMAKSFGAGSKLGIDLGGEVSGNLPTKQWKEKNIGESWYLGDTYHYGIGQGYMLATPLQVHSWGEVIANGGTLYQPRFNKKQEARIKKQDFLSNKTVSLIREGMIQSCSPSGVAYPLYEFKVQNAKLKVDGKNFIKSASGSANMTKIPVACKTGTAQHGGEETLPHAWITTFAPAYKPEIVVTVLVEESGEGSQMAAPIAKKVLEAYFVH